MMSRCFSCMSSFFACSSSGAPAPPPPCRNDGTIQYDKSTFLGKQAKIFGGFVEPPPAAEQLQPAAEEQE